MKAIAYEKFGTTEVLQIVERQSPSIKDDQVLVKVKTFSINPMDWKIRKGEMKLMSGSKFPKYTGADFAGVVVATGTSVKELKKGDEVFGVVGNIMKDGASAEYIAVPANLVWRKPSELSFAQAASIPVVGTAAVTTFEKMGHTDSQTRILVNGATGGYGMFLLQLLAQTDADVTAVTSAGGMRYAKQWGAARVVDYNKEDILAQKHTYDVVIDLSGKMGYRKAKQIMNPRSLFLNPTPKPIEIILSKISNLFTGKKHQVVLSSPSKKYADALLAAIRNGFEVEVNRIFPFTEFRQAYQYAEAGGFVGKVIIEFPEER
ncbi:NAD(P)-dependent alcohol dehydrogenase [Pedobacter faecalis]|uniref:NAD(P)-dependent alcohol dehydrogenase n=1 Tax=Pedobacter faecalis TaxID=3041495 RepID=UPI00254FD9D5|nr:NAD(P)-dependent alcohol dehydrogenase [Pedobacter sp. ELA7]